MLGERVAIGDRARRITSSVLLGTAAVVASVRIAEALALPGYLEAAAGTDIRYYLAACERWLAGGPWYEAFQLAGPYDYRSGVLYPPSALALLVPFTVLPLALWWAVPIAVTAWIVWSWRPSRMGWAVIAASLALPISLVHIINGNPVMWVAMLLAVSTRWPWASVLVIPLKPSLAPVAWFGSVRGGEQGSGLVPRWLWWAALGALALLSLAILPAWQDYLTALHNAGVPLWYSVKDIPIASVGLVAYVARHRQA